MRAFMVIGSLYGDEGKGLTTDWLVAQEQAAGRRCVVVRANGGTQAGHTVVTPQGVRKVHSHHGSGSLLGAPTYLGPEFLVSPMGWAMEREASPHLTEHTTYCSDQAPVQLPVDMMLNQLMEQRRGAHRHGSCGWGIGETVHRTLTGQFALRAKDLHGGKLGVTELYKLTTDYLRHRLPQLGLRELELPSEWQQRLHDGNILENWLAQAEQWRACTTPLHPADLPAIADTLVFEGAQGLGLDQEGAHHPHLTRSYTGARNPLDILRAINQDPRRASVESVECVYAVRAYATRHGAGPLEREGEPHGCVVDDPTNVPNHWQHSLRTAPLDIYYTADLIANDFARVLAEYPRALLTTMVTCVDQATSRYAYGCHDGHPEDEECTPQFMQGRLTSQARTFCLMLGHDTHGCRMLTSHGPTREHVQVDLEVPAAGDSHRANMRQLLQKMLAEAVA